MTNDVCRLCGAEARFIPRTVRRDDGTLYEVPGEGSWTHHRHVPEDRHIIQVGTRADAVEGARDYADRLVRLLVEERVANRALGSYIVRTGGDLYDASTWVNRALINNERRLDAIARLKKRNRR